MSINESNAAPKEKLMKKKAVICGMHQSICDLIARKLRSAGFIDVIGIYRDTTAALRDARHAGPDIVILDTELNGKALTDELTAVHQALPASKIVLFTAALLKPGRFEALPQGTVYIANKHDHVTQLLDITREASGMTREQHLQAPHGANIPIFSNHEEELSGKIQGTLTDKETQILTLIAMSNSTKQIANQLGISVHTVSNYRARIMYKISAKDQAGMVRYALVHGLVDPHL